MEWETDCSNRRMNYDTAHKVTVLQFIYFNLQKRYKNENKSRTQTFR